MSMRTALRSVVVVNRSSLAGTAMILALSAALLTATVSWLDAGLRDENLLMLVTLASSFAGTIVLITVFIVANVFSAALRPRRREFALMRAVGATPAQVRATVTAEAIVLLLVAAPIGAAIGSVLAPLLTPILISGGVAPTRFDLPFSPMSLLVTVAVLAPTGVLAARLTMRAAAQVSPTTAVKDSVIDQTEISRGRLLTAAGIALAGLLAAGTSFLSPGTIGAAGGASSAILLIIAAALAGPALVRWAALRGAALMGTSQGAGRTLAFANARGYSRRLSAAIVPLALLVALGTVQSGADTAVTTATADELRDGIRTDLIALSPAGITSEQAAAVAELPGVKAVTATEHLTASVRTDPPDDMPVMDRLAWEPTSLLTITPGDPLIDPAVRSGSLGNLDDGDTIAVSRDALLFTGKGLGDTIDVRVEGQQEQSKTIVAVYDRGMGFGDFIIGTTNTEFDTLFIDDADERRAATLNALTGLGLTAADKAGYVRVSTSDSVDEQKLSLILLLALLGFIAIAAANTLATSMGGRRSEFALLVRLGATRAQLTGMVAREVAFIAGVALAVGLLSALPALIGIGQGLLGTPLPTFDAPIVFGLIAATILITIVSVLPTAWLATSAAVSRMS